MFTTLKIWFTFLLRFSWPSIYVVILFFCVSHSCLLPQVETTLKWTVSLNLMQGSLSDFSISTSKINSQLKVTLNTNSKGDGEKVHTNLYTWGFFGTNQKNWCACAALLTTWRKNWKLYLSIYLIQLFSHTSTRQGLIVPGITSFLPFSTFLETIPSILFVPQYVLYSLVFHVILLK